MSLKLKQTRTDKPRRRKFGLEGELQASSFKKYTVGFFKRCWQYSICVLLLISSFSVTAFDEPVLTLVTGDMVAGLYHSTEQTGLVDELLELALKRMGYRLRVLTVPTERSLKMTESGLADGELLRTAAIEKYFPSLLQVPEALVESEFAVFSHQPIDLTEGWQALSGKSVGIIIGMKIIENKVPASALITKVKDEKLLFTLLKRKRIDYAVFVKDIGQFYLHKNNIKGLLVNKVPLDKVPAYTYLHPKHAALVPRLANTLKEMKQDGSFQMLVEQHLMPIDGAYSERNSEY
ncbi:MAG: transporter substrate-binding domain-containing protein [Gammaproteobacteria bacterium]|nr:transporter substrate-binding domain-containing protein [Gammaproteobacteria bacterium]